MSQATSQQETCQGQQCSSWQQHFRGAREITCPEPLTHDDRGRRSRLAASLIAAANDHYDCEVTHGPSDVRQQPPAMSMNQAPALSSTADASVTVEPDARACRGHKRAVCIDEAANERPLVHKLLRQHQPPRSRPPPLPHVKNRRPPPLPPERGWLTGACARLVYGSGYAQTGRPPDKTATAARRR